jgi:hypothetical protein
VTAVFGQDQFTLSVDADNGSGSGTVTSNIPGIDCGTICSHNYGRNTDVFLTAAPDPHSTFQGWSGDCSGGDPTACGVSMTDDKSVTALFVLDQFPVSLTKSGTGTGNVTSSPVGLACDATCNGASHNFDYGTEVTLTATPAAGSVLSGWTGDCSGTVANTCTVDVTDARSVEARFMQKLTIPSIATLTYSKATKKFKVKVSTSEMTSCRSGRKGAIKKVKPGPDATVKKFTTNGKGIAKVGLARVKGKYYVIVKTRKFTAANGAPVTCKATKSKPPLKLP